MFERSRHRPLLALAAGGACALAAAGGAVDAASKASHPLDIRDRMIIGRTILSGDVGGPSGREKVVLAEFFTGSRKQEDAQGILLGVYETAQAGRRLLWKKDYAEILGGPIAGGTLGLIDLEGDGVLEILVQVHHLEEQGTIRVVGEILRDVGGRPVTLWSGVMRIDTAGSDAEVAPVERERFRRDIDFGKTGRTRGGMIFFRKTVSMAAGVPFDPPEVVEESYPVDTRDEPLVPRPG